MLQKIDSTRGVVRPPGPGVLGLHWSCPVVGLGWRNLTNGDRSRAPQGVDERTAAGAALYAAIPKGKRIYLNWHDGFRIALAYLQLKHLGYGELWLYNGGWSFPLGQRTTLPVVEAPCPTTPPTSSEGPWPQGPGCPPRVRCGSRAPRGPRARVGPSRGTFAPRAANDHDALLAD